MEENMNDHYHITSKLAKGVALTLMPVILLLLVFGNSNVGVAHAEARKIDSALILSKNSNEITIDYSLGELDSGLQEAIDSFIRQNINQINTDIQNFTLTVYYIDDLERHHIRLFPTAIYQSNWELPYEDEDIISLIATMEDNGNWEIQFEDTSPQNVLNTDIVPITPSYSFPWTGGKQWLKTQGFHGTTWYALDFSPGNNTILDVLSIESGRLEPVCYNSDSYQAMVRVVHNNGIDISRYLHLAKNTIPSSKFNTQITKGQFIGSLYTGTAKINPPSACSDLSKYRYATPCGCGTATHLHFETNKVVTIQGISLTTISNAPYKTGYTSNNGLSTLSAPTDVSATDGIYEDRTEITWTPVNGATYYEVWRHTSNNIGAAALIASNAISPYSDAGGSLGKPYYYWVKACNTNGCSNFSTSNTGFRQTPGVVLLYAPTLTPSTITCDNYWMVASGIGYQGTNGYLTVNTNSSSQSTNSGIWQPSLPVSGKYKVEAYIGSVYNTTCSGTISGGYTGDAKYTVYHANGTTTVSKNQKNAAGGWLDIGTFSFNPGSNGKVKLSDLNGETNFSRIIFFNAMKFTLVETTPPSAFDKVSPINASIQVESPVTLTWTASNAAIDYDYCIDTTNDNSCDQWISAGSNTSVIVNDLLPNTIYYWQVKSENIGGITYANNYSTNYWSFTTQPIQGDDNYEENDTFTTAYDITNWKQAWLSARDGYGRQMDDDWYSISVTQDYQHITVDARFTHSQGDIDISLYDSYGNFLTNSHGITDNEYLTYLVPYPGIYYIKVYYANQGNQYDLRWDSLYTPPTFQDVPTNYWSWQYIERLYNSGVTGGCSSNPLMYCPTATVTRDQMAVFLLRGKHGSAYTPPPATGTMFADVPSNFWAAAWIEQLANEGITGGCGNGNYCPSTPVTRDQMAVFLLRGEHGGGYTPPAATGTMFADVPSTHWVAAWIEQLANEGITGGCGNGNYCPATPVTRDQMAVFLVRAFSLP